MLDFEWDAGKDRANPGKQGVSLAEAATVFGDALPGDPDDEMLPEYDFSQGARGKYYERYRQGTNVVLLEPDVARAFHDSATVNAALRRYLSEHGQPPSGKPAV